MALYSARALQSHNVSLKMHEPYLCIHISLIYDSEGVASCLNVDKSIHSLP